LVLEIQKLSISPGSREDGTFFHYVEDCSSTRKNFTMAELISIDLVLSALTAAYDFCQEVRNAPALIQKARKDAKKTRKQVELLRKRMNDPKSHLSRSKKEVYVFPHHYGALSGLALESRSGN
jgi:thiamine kinase-like enzyme